MGSSGERFERDDMDWYAQHFRVISWDNRGLGRSGQAAKYNLPLYAADAAHLLEKLGIEKAPPIVTRGLVFDVAGLDGGTHLNPGRVVTPDELAAAFNERTKAIILNTPNNPTGRLIPLEDLERIAVAARHAVVFVDEAYIEFGGESFLPRLGAHPNVLVGRTFSKAYGLAGMRVGVVIGQPEVLDPVRVVTLPFNINVVARVAVQAALEDTAFLPAYAAQVHESRTRLYAACDRLGLRYWPSAANYVLVQVGETAPFVEALAAKQIHVRDRSNDPATPGCIRVTAGMVTHTDAAIAALESVVARRQSR